jgi:hypothetical protein
MSEMPCAANDGNEWRRSTSDLWIMLLARVLPAASMKKGEPTSLVLIRIQGKAMGSKTA